MERYRLCLRNNSVSDHIKCSPKCCLKLTIAFITVVPVSIVLALLNISPSLNDVLFVVISVDTILLIVSGACWLILLRRKKKSRELAALDQQEGFGTRLEHGCTTGNPGSNMDVQHASVGNELLQCTSTQPANSINLAPLQSPLNNGSCRENDQQGTSPDFQTYELSPSTANEIEKVFTFYYDENERSWKPRNASLSTHPSKSDSVKNESLPSTSVSHANNCDLAQRQLPVNAGSLKEYDHEEPSSDTKTSDPVQLITNEKSYTLYYDEHLKKCTFKNSPQNTDAPESNCCVINCWSRPMKLVNVDRPTLSEKDESFELVTRSQNDDQQHSIELDKGYLASVEGSCLSLEGKQFEHNLSQTNPKRVHFAAAVEHLTSSEDDTSNRNPSSFQTNQRRGLPIAEGRHATSREYSGQDFPGNEKGHLTSSDTTSSSGDFGLYNRWIFHANPSRDLPTDEGNHVTFRESCEQGYPGNKSHPFPSSDTTCSSLDLHPNRGWQRQRSHSLPSQKKTRDIIERPSISPHDTMHCQSFTSNVDQIQSLSTPKNTDVFPPNANPSRSRILHQLLSAVLRNHTEVSPEVNSPLNHSEQPMPTQARRFDKPNVKFKRSPSNNYLINITMSLTPAEFHYFKEKRKNSGADAHRV